MELIHSRSFYIYANASYINLAASATGTKTNIVCVNPVTLIASVTPTTIAIDIIPMIADTPAFL